MTKIKNLIKIIMTLVVLTVLSACSDGNINPELRFNISLTEVSDISASVIVTHTGSNRVSYYAIAVPGEISDLNTEILKHKNKVLSDFSKESVYDQKKRVIKLSELIPETKYTCIVYGIDDNNEIIGIPASAVFKTSSSSILFSVNPLWTLTYKGQSKYNDKTYSKININVEGNVAERYFIRIFNKDFIDKFDNIKSILIHAFNEFNEQQNNLNDEYFWVENNYIRTESTDYYKYLFKGKYQAFAIGVDASGNLTGHYAFSEFFDFEKYELEPEYSDLLGDWELTDSVGSEIFFTLSEKWANNTLSMSGFGYNDCPLTLYYTPNGTYYLSIPGQSATGSAWSEDIIRTMTLRGWYIDEEYNFRIYTSQTISTLARAKDNNNGTFTFYPGFYINLKNDEKATTTGIILTFYNEDNKLHYYNSSKIQFPFTMRKVE